MGRTQKVFHRAEIFDFKLFSKFLNSPVAILGVFANKFEIIHVGDDIEAFSRGGDP
jgi:hypothetical protein